MRFKTTPQLGAFLQEYDPKYMHHSLIEYSIIKSAWNAHMLKVQGSEDDAFSLSDILDGTDIVYDDFYPKQKEKSPEEVEKYQAKLMELEYKQMTKGMEEKPKNYYAGSHKKEIGTIINCLVTVVGMFICFYALCNSIGCKKVTCVCSGLAAALGIGLIEIYYLLRTL